MENVKLHLGCGQRYLDGYINIDYPLDNHTAQNSSVADKFFDITKLNYKRDSIKEVRLHHVFEHFNRAQACALLSGWREWIEVGGVVHIEVPDFERTARSVLSKFTDENIKCVGLRHIFGSNEEFWAVHYEGWTPKRLSSLLEELGYKVERINKNSWKGTYNFEIIAEKSSRKITQAGYRKVSESFLAKFLLDRSASEKRTLEYWLKQYDHQLKLIWPKK
jgi:predicted SAM-dependent methyltransferase